MAGIRTPDPISKLQTVMPTVSARPQQPPSSAELAARNGVVVLVISGTTAWLTDACYVTPQRNSAICLLLISDDSKPRLFRAQN